MMNAFEMKANIVDFLWENNVDGDNVQGAIIVPVAVCLALASIYYE